MKPEGSPRLLIGSRGAVPWGWHDVLVAAAIAYGPVVALNLLASEAAGAATLGLTAGAALFVAGAFSAIVELILTLVVDGWATLWAWGYSLRRYRLGAAAWGFRRPRRSILWVVPLVVALNWESQALFAIPAPGSSLGFLDFFPHSPVGAVLLFADLCVVVPILEEVFHRGFVFQGLASSWGPLWGAIGSAVIFSAIHLEPDRFLSLVIMGLLFAWTFRRTGSLWGSIAAHVAVNGITFLIWLL